MLKPIFLCRSILRAPGHCINCANSRGDVIDSKTREVGRGKKEARNLYSTGNIVNFVETSDRDIVLAVVGTLLFHALPLGPGAAATHTWEVEQW